MKKQLFFIIFSFFIVSSAFSTRLDLSLTDLNAGWGSSYAAETKTITFDGEWNGRGWGWWSGGLDASSYTKVVVNFDAVDVTVKLVVQYNDESTNTPEIFAQAGEETIVVTLDADKKSNIMQIYLQKATAGTLTLKEAYLEGESATPSAVINFEDDEIDHAYSSIAWSAENITAVVKANPTNAEEKSLHVTSNNWNAYPKFSVSLPDALTLGDIQKIKFDLYLGTGGSADQNSWKSVHCFLGAPGASFTANVPTIDANNLIQSETREVWFFKEITLSLTDDNLKALSQFDLGLGIGVESADYYIDNIEFIPTETAGTDIVKTKNDIYFSANILNLKNAGTVQIFDINGRLLISQDNISSLDLSSMASGLYVVKARIGESNQVVKFIK